MSYEAQFRRFDSDAPQVTTVEFYNLELPDQYPDFSYLEQDYSDCSEEEAKRLAAYDRGEWDFVGLVVTAKIRVLAGGHSFVEYEIRSPGLWGTESDTADTEKADTWAEERKELTAHLRAVGTAFLVL